MYIIPYKAQTTMVVFTGHMSSTAKEAVCGNGSPQDLHCLKKIYASMTWIDSWKINHLPKLQWKSTKYLVVVSETPTQHGNNFTIVSQDLTETWYRCFFSSNSHENYQ